MEENIVRVKGLVESLASTEETLSDNCLKDYILGGLGSEYSYLLTIVRNRAQAISFDELSDLLLGEELLMKRIEEENQSKVTVAMEAQTRFRDRVMPYYNLNYRNQNNYYNPNYNPNPNYNYQPNYIHNIKKSDLI